MPHNPFAGVRITGTWEDHADYSAGGTDLPLGYGTPIPAPASGVLRVAGGSGEFEAGWVGTAGRRSVLTLDSPLPRLSPRRSTPAEAEGPMVAVVLQHQSKFGLNATHYDEGDTCGWSGASASGQDYGGDVHLHWHGLDAAGRRLRIESFLPQTGAAGLDTATITEEEPAMDEVRYLHAPNGTIFRLSPGLKVNFDSVEEYNAYRGATEFYKSHYVARGLDVSGVVVPPPLENVMGVDWNGYRLFCKMAGVSDDVPADGTDALVQRIVAGITAALPAAQHGPAADDIAAAVRAALLPDIQAVPDAVVDEQAKRLTD